MSESWCMAVGIPRIDMCLRVGAWLLPKITSLYALDLKHTS